MLPGLPPHARSHLRAPADPGYDRFVRYVIDGNNLMHALAACGEEVGRYGLCKLLSPLARRESVTVAFDGPRPEGQMDRQIRELGVEVVYAPGRPADERILARIGADSDPRRLAVVSTDREIRTAARRRRCKVIRSEDFAPQLLAERRAAAEPPPPAEPPEKRRGLSPGETKRWLREFGLD